MFIAQAGFLSAAGLIAGLVNGAAGGGSLISFPALLAVGYPALGANVTSTVAIWPGYLGGTAGFHREVGDQRDRVRSVALTTFFGSVMGAVLLLTTPGADFRRVAPYLIIAACVLFAGQPVLTRYVRSRGSTRELHPALLHTGTFCCAIYGSYFGAGLGVLLLGVLGVALPDHLLRLNGLRAVLSLGINSVAVAIFAIAAPVAWSAVAIMGVTSLVGGYFGARFARWLPAIALRALVISLGLFAATRLLIK